MKICIVPENKWLFWNKVKDLQIIFSNNKKSSNSIAEKQYNAVQFRLQLELKHFYPF